MKVQFPVKHSFEGVEYAEITLDFSFVTGSVIERIEGEMTANGAFAPMLAINQGFLRRVAAVASGKPSEFFAGMHPANYFAVTQKVQAFLTGAESLASSNEDSFVN